MKIAFISYEYPPDTAKGGIATYVYNVALMLHNAGNQVEVFAGTHKSESYSSVIEGVFVHRIHIENKKEFSTKV
jgi:glycogen synthase